MLVILVDEELRMIRSSVRSIHDSPSEQAHAISEGPPSRLRRCGRRPHTAAEGHRQHWCPKRRTRKAAGSYTFRQAVEILTFDCHPDRIEAPQGGW